MLAVTEQGLRASGTPDQQTTRPNDAVRLLARALLWLVEKPWSQDVARQRLHRQKIRLLNAACSVGQNQLAEDWQLVTIALSVARTLPSFVWYLASGSYNTSDAGRFKMTPRNARVANLRGLWRPQPTIYVTRRSDQPLILLDLIPTASQRLDAAQPALLFGNQTGEL